MIDFYSRPCGRGDFKALPKNLDEIISTHAPAGGATEILSVSRFHGLHFYSRPCGRGDRPIPRRTRTGRRFLLTPLREGRREAAIKNRNIGYISTHAPAGGATVCQSKTRSRRYNFYSRPCGRGDYRHGNADERRNHFYSRPCGRGDKNQHLIGRGAGHFYSRPCGRGDTRLPKSPQDISSFLLTPLREGRRNRPAAVFL